MSGLYWSDGMARLKGYTSNTKHGAGGAVTSLKIELVVSDHYALASILNQLDEISAEQKVGKPKTLAPKKRQPPLALPAPPLQIPYFGDAE